MRFCDRKDNKRCDIFSLEVKETLSHPDLSTTHAKILGSHIFDLRYSFRRWLTFGTAHYAQQVFKVARIPIQYSFGYCLKLSNIDPYALPLLHHTLRDWLPRYSEMKRTSPGHLKNLPGSCDGNIRGKTNVAWPLGRYFEVSYSVYKQSMVWQLCVAFGSHLKW